MEQAESLSSEQRQYCRVHTILSTCWGALAGVLVSDSAIIILFATALGAGDMLSMITTSLTNLFSCLLLIPAALLSNRVGYKQIILRSSLLSSAMIILAGLAPLFGSCASLVLIAALSLYALSMAFYEAAWYPLVDAFLLRSERGRYFGTMRFSWQLTAAVFFFVCGLMMGKNPPLWVLQIIIFITALGLLGRFWHISRIPKLRQDDRPEIALRAGLLETIGNKSLTGFSVYLCCLFLAAYATLPLIFLYVKKYLCLPDNVVVMMSSFSLGGTMVGYLVAGKLVDRYGVKPILLLVHFSFALVNFIMFFIGGNSTSAVVLICLLTALYGFFVACSSISVTSEMMALASKNNKAISMAFCGSFCAAGIAGSRLITSFILGTGMFAPQWFLGGMKISHYQTLFLFYGFAIIFVCLMLVLVPAIFPKRGSGEMTDTM